VAGIHGGGTSARWNGNGKELFYVVPNGTVMSVEHRRAELALLAQEMTPGTKLDRRSI
jgi:hypothetical protein